MCQHAALGLSTIKHRCTLTAITSGWAVKRNGWSRTTVAMSAWTRCSSLTTAANVGGKSSLCTKERAKAIRNAWRRKRRKRRRRKRKVEMMKMCRYNLFSKRWVPTHFFGFQILLIILIQKIAFGCQSIRSIDFKILVTVLITHIQTYAHREVHSTNTRRCTIVICVAY